MGNHVRYANHLGRLDDPVTSEAHARLIAAAPDLLAALKRRSAGMDSEFDTNPRVKADEVKMARAAIAKAEQFRPRRRRHDGVSE